MANRSMPDLKLLKSKISGDDVHSDIDNYYYDFDNQMALNEFSTRVAEEVETQDADVPRPEPAATATATTEGIST